MQVEQPLRCLHRARLVRAPAVQFDELPGHGPDGVRPFVACRDLLAAGIATFGDDTQSLAGQGAGRLEIDCRKGAQGVLARLTADAVAHGPTAGARRLHDQIQSRQMAIGDLFTIGAGLDGLDGADGEGARHGGDAPG